MKRMAVAFVCMIVLGMMTSATAQPRMRSAEENAKALKEQLDLNDAQMKDVTVILREQQKKVTDLRSKGEPGPEMRDAFMKISGETDEKIMKVLDEGQQKKYKKLMQERREMRGRRRQN